MLRLKRLIISTLCTIIPFIGIARAESLNAPQSALEVLESAELFICAVGDEVEMIGVLQVGEELVPLGDVQDFTVERVDDGLTFAGGSDFILIASGSFSGVLNGNAVSGICNSAERAKQTVLLPLLERSAGDPIALARRLESTEIQVAELLKEVDAANLRVQEILKKNPEVEGLKASLDGTVRSLKVANDTVQTLRGDLLASREARNTLTVELSRLRESEASSLRAQSALRSRICRSDVLSAVGVVDRAVGPASARPADQDRPELARAVGDVANALRQVCK
jgi:hypothetical protein